MSANDNEIIRDLENDVLYIIRKEVNKASTLNVDVNDDTTIRFDRRTHEVVGFTITDFSKSIFKRLSDKSDYEIMEQFDFIMNSVNTLHKIEHQKA